MAAEILKLSAVSKFYTGNQSVVVGLQEINLTFRRGEFVAVTGESGSGKSTLSHVLGGILPYESGELFFCGNPTSHYDSGDWECYRRDHISFISQSYGILPGATVLENVTSALTLTGMSRRQARERGKNLLKQVELWDLRSRRAAKLSSGQKQRLSIARALAKPAPILIADEPTGNLDPENSAKVMELLAQAAQERLVILVTHEFSEAVHLATRHIVLQDGKVVMDAPLAPAKEPKAMEQRTAAHRPVGGYVGRLQQRSRPVWSGVMIMFFALTAFAVFAFLGTLIMNLDDSNTKGYDASIFPNGDLRRIVVANPEGTALSATDWQTLANLEGVQQVEPWGYVTDSQYGYREGVDFDFSVRETAAGIDGTLTQVTRYPILRTSAPYLQTVPVLPEGTEFLTAGRLPENLYEVVAVGDASQIGKTETVYLTNDTYWARGKYLELEVTVVGVTEWGSNLYFHEDLARLWMQIRLVSNRRDLTNLSVFLPNLQAETGHYVPTLAQKNQLKQNFEDMLDSVYTFGKISEIQDVTKKTYFNINSLTDPETDQEITLDVQASWHGSFYLRNVQTRTPLSGTEEGALAEKNGSIQEGAGEEWVFYPLDGTQMTEEGMPGPGTYLLYNPANQVILTGNWQYCNEEACYETLPAQWDEEGNLTNYPESAVWTVRIQTGSVYLLQQNGEYLRAFQKGEAMLATGGNERFWVVRKALTYDTLANNNLDIPEVSLDAFRQLTWDGGSEQVSLTITDYAYASRVLEEARSLGYAAVSPYQLGSVKKNDQLAQEREQTLLICLISLGVVIALQMILLRAMFATQTESYRLLSNIGLSAKMAGRSILWQVITFALAGQILGCGVLAICWDLGVERIVEILRYLPWWNRILLSLVHLLVSLGAAAWIICTLRKQVYALTGKEIDLVFPDEQREVAV